MTSDRVPIVDLFAGPGGLGEGFAAYCHSRHAPAYRIALSIEKDEVAHRTLQLRAFFRQFKPGRAPSEYYDHLRNPGTCLRSELFAKYPKEAELAQQEAWNAELGAISEAELDRRVKIAIDGAQNWLLIGGPPCQAYSIVGRARRGGMSSNDPRVHLYREYLRILAVHHPPVFIMENVKGLLSAKLDQVSVLDRMLDDLSSPHLAAGLPVNGKKRGVEYKIQSLVRGDLQITSDKPGDPRDFIIQCERYGIPQARHRLILLGVRADIPQSAECRLKPSDTVALHRVLSGLPALRSGLSKQADSQIGWREAVQSIQTCSWFRKLLKSGERQFADRIAQTLISLSTPENDRGAEYLSQKAFCDYRADWFLDPKLSGICNHVSRGHIVEDLRRYFFAASYAEKFGKSPTLKDFPEGLLPNHDNVPKAIASGHFSDRFRVQLKDRPATTVTSHIAKDGHYYIHYDPTQCRSLTVREAARVQTFPDNYFFCGNRTQQYQQVGNAVPPLLAHQIAEVVYPLLTR